MLDGRNLLRPRVDGSIAFFVRIDKIDRIFILQISSILSKKHNEKAAINCVPPVDAA